MSKNAPHPPTFIELQELERLFFYDPDTGCLVSYRIREPVTNRTYQGYVVASAGGRNFRAHHVVWFFVTGAWPTQPVGFKNRDRSDVSFDNLFLTDDAKNQLLQDQPKSHNMSGARGVTPYRGKYRAAIRINGVCKHLGTFDDVESAAQAYKEAKSGIA